MRPKNWFSTVVCVAATLSASVFCFGQGGTMPPIPAADKPFSTLYFETKLGSFKIKPFNAENPSWGRLEMSFEGTVLVSGLDGEIQVSGDVRKEYENDKYRKTVYHGKGKIVLVGKIKGLQWFGQNLSGSFDGKGVVFLQGEYDADLSTGWFWYSSLEKAKKPWYTGGITITVPLPDSQRPKRAVIKPG